MSEEEQLEAYAEALLAKGMEEREVARAYFYAKEYGLDAVNPEAPNICSIFDEPNCGNWNCLNPKHQVLQFVPTNAS